MNSPLMNTEQQSASSATALWSLGAGQALRLSIGPGVREVHVAEGRLWLTSVGTPSAPPEDIWLSAGESIALESGSEWVAEGWGVTRFQLLVPPRACSTSHGFSAWSLRRVSALRVTGLVPS